MEISTNTKLDALVAEKVMGMVPCDGWERTNLGSAGGPAMMKNCQQHSNCYPKDQPMAFSTLIAAAWQVVEYLAEKEWEVTVKRLISSDLMYEAMVDKRTGNPEDRFITNAGSAPLAICVAALRASGYNSPLP